MPSSFLCFVVRGVTALWLPELSSISMNTLIKGLSIFGTLSYYLKALFFVLVFLQFVVLLCWVSILGSEKGSFISGSITSKLAFHHRQVLGRVIFLCSKSRLLLLFLPPTFSTLVAINGILHRLWRSFVAAVAISLNLIIFKVCPIVPSILKNW